MTQQSSIGRALGIAQGLQGMQSQSINQQLGREQLAASQEQRALQAQQREAAAAAAQQFQQAVQRFQGGDPSAMADMVILNPDLAGQIREGIGAVDESRATQLQNTALGFKQAVQAGPESAVQYFQQNMANDPAFAEIADEVQSGQFDRALMEMRAGVAAIGGQDALSAFDGPAQEPTAFMQEMQAAGIAPGSEEFKSAVLERYGKGDTIAYDVVEAVNPQTGMPEYYQVSRTQAGDVYRPTGLQVPEDARVTAKRAETEAEAAAMAEQELGTITDMLQNVDQILESPGLKSWSGWQGVLPIAPGSEQANTDAYIERLKSQQFLENIGAMKGMGALSNAEGLKVSAAAASINRYMTDDAIERELNRIREELDKARQRIESGDLLSPESNRQSGDSMGANAPSQQATPRPVTPTAPSTVNWADL